MESLYDLECDVRDIDSVINSIMIKYGTDVLRLVYSYVKDKEIAEDLTQEIFVKCYKSLHTFKSKSNIKTWIWRIAINHSKDYLKSWYKNNVTVSEEIQNSIRIFENGLDSEVIENDENRHLARIVMNLPVIYREVIFLYYYEDMSIKEVSLVLKVNQNTIKTRLRKAKELLKKTMEV